MRKESALQKSKPDKKIQIRAAAGLVIFFSALIVVWAIRDMANLKNQNQPRSVPLNIPSNIYRDANNLNYPPQQQPQESINQPQESMIKEPPLASSNKIPECETETDPEDKDTCYMSLSKTKKQCKNIQDFSIRQDCLDTTD